MGRPIYRETIETQVARLENRVAALERRRDVSGFYQIKVFADDEIVTTGNGKFVFAVPWDLNKARLNTVNCYITTVSSSGLVTVQIHNLGSTADPAAFDMLTTPMTIDVGETNAETAATPAVIDNTPDDEYPYPDRNNTVYYGQQLRIDVDTAGTGAAGLGVMLGFD